MAAAAFFFSVMSLLVKVAGSRLPSQQIVFARALIGAVLSGWLLRRRGVAMSGNRRGLLLLRSLLGYGALSCFFYALTELPLADATVIHYTNPVFTALLAAWLLSEGIRLRELALVLSSLVGVALIARPSFLFGAESALDPVAVAIALAGALLSAGAYVTVRKLGQTEDPIVVVFYFAVFATIASIPVMAPSAVWPTSGEWAALLGVGVSTQLGQVALTRGLQLERAGRAMAVGYLQIVFAALWGILFFAEIPRPIGVVGALVIMLSTLGVARGAR